MLEVNKILEVLKVEKINDSSYLIDDIFVKVNLIDTRKPLVYTFSNAGDITREEDVNSSNYSPWGFEFVKKKGINVISFSAVNTESWYRSSKFHTSLEQVFSEISNLFPRRLGYGSSMGGFGASVFADILNIHSLLLINPISSLNSSIAPFETRFKYGRSLNWEGAYNDGAKNQSSGYVVFDPIFDLDSKHAKRYLSLEKLKFFGVGHSMPAHLQRIGILGELFDRFLSNRIDSYWFYKSIRKRRGLDRYYKWLISNENVHLTPLRKQIINNACLKYELDQLHHKIIDQSDVDYIRDAAVALENVNLECSYKLMKLALRFRPSGPFIKSKVEEYRDILNK